jgi:hypothetical protein
VRFTCIPSKSVMDTDFVDGKMSSFLARAKLPEAPLKNSQRPSNSQAGPYNTSDLLAADVTFGRRTVSAFKFLCGYGVKKYQWK